MRCNEMETVGKEGGRWMEMFSGEGGRREGQVALLEICLYTSVKI